MMHLEHNINTYVQEWVILNKFSGTVFLAKDNIIVFNKSYGMANYSYDVANTTQTKFHISSITKQFTATAIFLLVQKELITLDDSLATFFPDYPQGNKIRIRHLLTHTSGIPNLFELPGALADLATPLTMNQILAKFKNKPLVFQPGQDVDYCNSAYILLALIIEKISGQQFDVFLQKNIFEPVGMKNTGFLDRTVIIKNLATGYSLDKNGFVNATFYIPKNLMGAIGVYATSEDLYLWDRALRANKILSAELTEQMLMSPKIEDGSGMASGWMVNDLYGHRCVWHDGTFYDTHTIMCRFIDDDMCLVILCNIEWTKSPVEKMAEDIIAMLFDKPYQMPSEQQVPIALSLSEMQAYVGKYQYRYYNFRKIFMSVFIQDNKLFLQAVDFPAASQVGDFLPTEMVPKPDGRFFLALSTAEISFAKNNDGSIDKLILNYGGEVLRNTFEAKKIN